MPAKLTLAALAFLMMASGNTEQSQPQPRRALASAPAPARRLAAIEQASGGRLGVVLLDARGRTLFAHRPD